MSHAKAWVKNGNSVTWFTSQFTGGSEMEEISGVSIIRSGRVPGVYFRAFLFYLKHREEFDIVIDEIHGIPFFTPLYVRKPKIAFIHEVAIEIWDYMYPFPLNILGKIIERFYFIFYKSILFWTDAPSTIKDLEAFGISATNCTAIACPISNKPLTNLPKKEAVPTFLFVSRIVKMKGIEDVIAAFGLIAKKQPKAQLWIIGNGEAGYVHSLKTLVRKKGLSKHVLFLGRLVEKEKLNRMQRAHLLLHASVREGWGLVVLEAASQGTPSVVYNVSGLCDTVKNAETGVIVSQNTPEELAKETEKLLSDNKRYVRLQKNGLAWVKSFSWKEAGRQSTKLLQDTIKSV